MFYSPSEGDNCKTPAMQILGVLAFAEALGKSPRTGSEAKMSQKHFITGLIHIHAGQHPARSLTFEEREGAHAVCRGRGSCTPG